MWPIFVAILSGMHRPSVRDLFLYSLKEIAVALVHHCSSGHKRIIIPVSGVAFSHSSLEKTWLMTEVRGSPAERYHSLQASVLWTDIEE